MSSLEGLGAMGCPGPGSGLWASSDISMSLPRQGRHLERPHFRALAHGLLEPSNSATVCPPHLSMNLTLGLFRHSPRVSSTVWRALRRVESLVKGIKTGVSIVFILAVVPWLCGGVPSGPLGAWTFHVFSLLGPVCLVWCPLAGWSFN